MLTTHDDLKHVSVVIGGQPPTGFEAGAQVLSSWLDATKTLTRHPATRSSRPLETASKQVKEERKTSRSKILEQTALQRTPMATARAALETLAWADLILYHSWRLTESLRIVSDH